MKKATSQTLKELRELIDDYIDYEDQSDRLKSDKAVRFFLINQVLGLMTDFSKIQNSLMKGQMLSTWSLSNSIGEILKKLRAVLSTKNYSSSTFFESSDVSVLLEVTVLYTLEHECILQLNKLKKEMQDINTRLESLDMFDMETDIVKIRNAIRAVHKDLSDRAELIASFEIVN
jgi:ribosomal protein S8